VSVFPNQTLESRNIGIGISLKYNDNSNNRGAIFKKSFSRGNEEYLSSAIKHWNRDSIEEDRTMNESAAES